MNQQTVSNHLGAYGTRSVIINEHSASDKIGVSNKLGASANLGASDYLGFSDKLSASVNLGASDYRGASVNLGASDYLGASDKPSASPKHIAYNTGPSTTGLKSASDKLSAYDISSVTRNQYNASNKLSAYDISSVTRSRFSDVLHVGQQAISLDKQCLDPECSDFCPSFKDEPSKTERDCSEDDFSLNMDGVLNAFGPFGRSSLAPIPEHTTPTKTSQAAGPNLRDLGLSTSNPSISDPELLVYPGLRNRVGRYFEARKPTPEGWTWSVNGTLTAAAPLYAPTQSSVALTDSSTIASGSVTELSQTYPSRPSTPQMGPYQLSLYKMSPRPPTPQTGPPYQMALYNSSPLPVASLQMALVESGPPQMGPLTAGPVNPLNPIAVIGKMREIQTEGVQPFGPSRFLNHPHGNPTGNPNGNYLGTMSAASNQMTNLPDHLNTCIWVEGAPADLTYYEMLRSIHHCGKVYSVHINPPREKHFTAAAKIAFCTRLGAEHFFHQAHSGYGIVIRGRRLCVRWNRNKYRENFNRGESRVLRISGPSAYINYPVLAEYFSRLFYFNLIWVHELSPGVMIWEFSSILAQAHSAKQAIEREPAMMNLVRIKYERDPCE
ncbi:hypothetical protein VE00_04594 [Pseudogymnoascus sp. WSF 3629]|nr:hypothetical protein VE00_04594 [Pseudogymnoascus sp. WSF 3629]